MNVPSFLWDYNFHPSSDSGYVQKFVQTEKMDSTKYLNSLHRESAVVASFDNCKTVFPGNTGIAAVSLKG